MRRSSPHGMVFAGEQGRHWFLLTLKQHTTFVSSLYDSSKFYYRGFDEITLGHTTKRGTFGDTFTRCPTAGGPSGHHMGVSLAIRRLTGTSYFEAGTPLNLILVLGPTHLAIGANPRVRGR